MKNWLYVLLGITTAWLFADQRNFAWTYEYKTMEAGEAEFEYYFSTKVYAAR